MRNLLLVLLIKASLSTNAQIPNGSFENWTNGKPDSWLCRSNGIDPVPYELPVVPAAAGNVACKVIVRAITITTQTGSTPTCLVGFLKLIDTPISFAPICLSGSYKFFAADTNDTLSIKAIIKSNGTVIGAAEFTATTSNLEFQNFCEFVNYTSNSVPTSYEILASLNSARPLGAVNSYFILDDLQFNSLNEVGEKRVASAIVITPNPIINDARVSFDGAEVAFDALRVANIFGQTVKELSVNSSVIELQLQELPSGIYYLQILKSEKVLAIEKLIKL